MKTKLNRKVSQKEVEEAIKRFNAEGGIIHKLPDQRPNMAQSIGNGKYDTFESLSNFLPW